MRFFCEVGHGKNVTHKRVVVRALSHQHAHRKARTLYPKAEAINSRLEVECLNPETYTPYRVK